MKKKCEMFERVKRFYKIGLYSATQAHDFPEKGVLTEEECNAIVKGGEK